MYNRINNACLVRLSSRYIENAVNGSAFQPLVVSMQGALHGAFKGLANALRTKLGGGLYFSVLLSLQDHGPSSAGFFLATVNTIFASPCTWDC